MYVEFGNDKAIEGYRDPNSDDPELVRYKPIDGQRVTTVSFPEGISLQEAFTTAVTAITYHMEEGAEPAWIESDSEGLQSLLQEHFGITASKNNRPKAWGKDTGATELPRPGDTGEDA